MKKNITINLFGQLYAIDEDAYELLKNYEENMRSYFRSKEGGEDIADDIEHRVAELLAEMKAEGIEAVSIGHVEEIIRRIGNPEQMEDEGDGTPASGTGSRDGGGDDAPRTGRWKDRRLYRDPQDAMLGGVMSGLCRYFGHSDPLFWRLGMILFFVCSYTAAGLGYLVLWALVPQATTAEDRLRMKGQPVNTETLNEEIMRGVNRAKEFVGDPTLRRKAHGCLGTLLSLIVKTGKAVLLLGAGCIFFFLLIILIGLLFLAVFGISAFVQAVWPYNPEQLQIMAHIPGITWQLWVLGIALLAVVAIPLYRLVCGLIGYNRKALSPKKRLTIAFGWIASVALAGSLLTVIILQTVSMEKRLEREENTRNGIYLRPESRKALDNAGWEIMGMKGCSPSLYLWCDDVTGGCRRPYISAESDYGGNGMALRLQRTVTAAPGTYYIEGLAFADGTGSFAYVSLPGQDKPLLTEIPVTGEDAVGNIKDITWRESRGIPFFSTVRDTVQWDSIRHAGRKWNYLRSKPFRHPGGKLGYGIACDNAFKNNFCSRTWNGSRLALLDMTLTRTDSLTEKANH